MLIIHHFDLDGRSSAAIIKYRYPDTKTYEINYGEDIPWDLIRGEDVFIVDFSFEPEDMKRVIKEVRSLIWIDHHISAIQKLKGLADSVEGLRDESEEYAGCELTWKYIFPKDSIPRVVSLLGRYDVHDYMEDTILPFQYAMRTKDTDPSENFDFWVELFTDYTDEDSCGFDFLEEESLIDKIIEEGRPIERFIDNQNESFVRDNAVTVILEGHKFLAVNTYLSNSNALEKFFNRNKWDAMMTFYRKSGGWRVSLYNGDEGKIDCSKIAGKFGGGGHFSASSFFCERLPFEV